MNEMTATKRLAIVWLLLLVLTLVTGLSANFLSEVSAMVLVPVMAMASLIKARLILSYYLDLRQAPQWNQAFLAILIVLVAIVYLLQLVAYFK